MNKILFIFILINSILVFAQNLKPSVVYSSDERKEVLLEEPRDMMSYIQKRTLAMIPNAYLFNQADGSVNFLSRYYGRAFRLCATEQFYNQPSLPRCTATIIGKNKVLTAGHCISENGCAMARFVADYAADENMQIPHKTDISKIYACKQILYRNDSDELDVAIVEVDRDFEVSPLKIANTNQEQGLTPNDQILAVGFPAGLPMKSSGLGPIREITDTVIKAELDTYGGNSGSAIFKKNSDIIQGILVRGEDDFVLAESKKCFVTRICDSNSAPCKGEEIIPANTIQNIISQINLN